ALADGVTYRARQESTADVSSGGKRSSNDQGRSTAAPAAGNPWDPILSLGSMIPDHGRATQAQSCRSLRKDGDDGDDDADLGQSQSVQRNIDEMKAKHEAHGPWAMARRIPPGEDVPIQVVNVLRVLGVWIDERLTFQHHIRLKVSEALAKLNRLRHLGWERASLTGAKVIRTYRVGILPGLAHGVCVWYDGLKSATARDLVMRVPAMVARIALRAPRNASNSALVVAAGLTPAHVELAGMAARRLALLGDEIALDRLLKVKGLQHEQPSTRLGTVIAEREQALHSAKQAMRSRNAIFTDGSVVLDRRAGAGCVVFRKGVQAARGVIGNAVAGESWEIFTDSQA
ncbi:hypothetical protein FOZ63_005558, partial [Perkinsus olseni]